jgi:uncharacterized protein YbaR (Trm112 family)
MHIELIDLLRCPREHEETWLVAAFTKIEDRFVVEGKLGCPVCNASYVISDGIADLRQNREVRVESHPSTNNPDDAMRVAALLGLTVPNALAVLEGSYASTARGVSELTQCRVIALNPPYEIEESEAVGVVLTDSRIPFASNSVYGIAVQAANLLNDVPRILRQRGRLITTIRGVLPAGINQIASDERDQVGEAVGPVVKLRREQRE